MTESAVFHPGAMTPEQFADLAAAAADRASTAADAAHRAAEAAHLLANSAEIASEGAAIAIGAAAGVDPFVFRLSIFVLAIFVGYYVVWSVTPALHTPLMSVTNAISSVIVVGALLAVGVDVSADLGENAWTAKLLGFGALILASVNIVGGFMVTQRMLSMYKKKPASPDSGGTARRES